MEHWRYAHNKAIQEPEGPERAIVLLRSAISEYVADAEWSSHCDHGQWRDYVLGPYVGALLSAFIGLLNGDLGRLDRGTLGDWAYVMADRIGYNMDTGEYGL